MDRNRSIEDLFALTDEEAKEILKWLNSTEDKKIKTPLEKLGYKRVKEINYFTQILGMRYEKDTTIYKFADKIVPKDRIQYRCTTILISKKGAECIEGFSSNSFEEARENSVTNPLVVPHCSQITKCLTWEEMEALLEMRKKGEFNKLK